MDIVARVRALRADGCRLVYQDCPTGIGDKLLDAMSGAALSRLNGCRRPLVLMRNASSSSRQYDVARVTAAFDMLPDDTDRSEFRKLARGLYNMTAPLEYPDEWIFLGRPCGIHKPAWLLNSSRHALQRVDVDRELRRISRSVRIRGCNNARATTIPDIHERVGIHIRRTDKLRRFGTAMEREWKRLYASIPPWLLQHGHRKAFLAGDDVPFLHQFAQLLRTSWGVDVATSTAANALDDLCSLSQTSVVLQASIQSHFAALAAIIGPGVLVVLNGTSVSAVNESCRGWVEAGALTVVVAPLL